MSREKLSGKDKTAIVTGASSGIGLAISQRLHERGWNLLMVARHEQELAEAARALDADYYPADVSDPLEVGEIAYHIDEDFPFPPPSLLVNSAGVGLGKSFLRSSYEEDERLARINMLGAFNCIRALKPALYHQLRHTDIITITSAAATSPLAPSPMYSASKAGLLAGLRAMAPQLARRQIAIHRVVPGFADTPGFPQDKNTLPPFFHNRFLKTTPEKIAEAAIGLVGKSAKEIYVPRAYRVMAIGTAIAPVLSAKISDRQFRGYRPPA